MSEGPISQDSQRGEALLSWIQQFSPYGVVTLDKTLAVQSWNHWMELHSGKSIHDVVGRNLVSLFPELKERRLVAPLERALAGESCVLSTALHRYMFSFPSPLRDQGYKHMRQTTRIAPLIANNEVRGVVIVIEDVTQREYQAEILTLQHRRDEMLSWALSQFLRSEEPRKTVRQLFFKLAEHLDFDAFLLFLRDVESGEMALDDSGGLSPEMKSTLAGCRPLISALDFPEIAVFEDVKASSNEEYDALRKANVSAAVAIPLVANTRKLGVLCFSSWTRDKIKEDERDLLTTVGQYLATALDREQTSLQLRKARLALQSHADLLEKKVEERTTSLKESLTELETFSYTLAHDLKAPVRGMSQYCDALIEDFGHTMPKEARFMLDRLARTPRKMEALVHDLLEFSKVSRQEVRLSAVEIGPVLEDILALRVVEVRQVIAIQPPLFPVIAHPALLQQVLANLIDNAVKFVGPQRKPEIMISSRLVDHKSPSTRATPLLFSAADTSYASRAEASQGKIVRIQISDKGIGIPRESHQKIFGIFERGLNSEVYEGTGIGLAIVARAVQRMKGTCGVESEPNQGSCFWVELPSA